METRAPNDPNRFAQQLFSPLPARYDRLAEVLSMGQNGRWRSAMIDHIVPEDPALVLDVACGPAGVSLQIARTHACRRGRGRPDVRDAAPGPAERRRTGHGRPGPIGRRPGRAAAVRRCDLRRAHLHLSAALRRRSRCDTARARPGGQAGRHGGQPGVPAPAEPLLAVLVVGLHQARPPGRWVRHRGQGVAGGRPVPRAQHLGALPALSARLDGPGLGRRPDWSTSACGG